VCYLFKQTVFVYCCDLDEDQISFYDQFMQKSSYFQSVHILFLATVYSSIIKYSIYHELICQKMHVALADCPFKCHINTKVK
jgi:hypothetical protein